MSNLPKWESAATVYGSAYKVLERMGESGHVTKPIYKYGKMVISGSVSQEMQDLISALGKGDEAEIKGMLLQPNYFKYR